MSDEPIELSELERLQLENAKLKVDAAQVVLKHQSDAQASLLRTICDAKGIELTEGERWAVNIDKGVLFKMDVQPPKPGIVAPSASDIAATEASKVSA